MGNYVINTARVFKGKEKPAPNRLARKRIGKQTTAALMKHCLALSAAIAGGIAVVYLRRRRKAFKTKPKPRKTM
ncbi:hypothetical protein FACS1894211_03760 [Clostridia bacterium]|nr:hypothetical protein FACS1894211_03760 [Clostridia bacterium]